MKLLVVTPYFYPKTGGLENYAWNIATGLKEKFNWEIVAITSNHNENKYIEEQIEGIKIYRLPTLIKVSNTPVNPNWYTMIKEIIKKEEPDIINGHTPVPFIADITSIIASQLKIPFVLTYHNDLIKNNNLIQSFIKAYYLILGNRAGKLASKIITSSDYYAKKSFFLKKFTDKIEIVSPGVDISLYEATKEDQDLKQKFNGNKVVLFVGQLDRTHIHKGLHNLVDAINKVKETIPNVKLVVIGKGDMVNEYKTYVDKTNLSDYVIFEESVDNTRLIQYYKLCDLVVLPSINKSEGFGMVLIEAGACKKPVIGSNIGGIPYVIKNNINGILVAPGDVKALGTSIASILENENFALGMGKKNYEIVKNNFDWAVQIKKTHTIFQSLL